MLAARREGDDRHRLDDGERILLHEDAVFERSGLRLVGVADQEVGLRWLFRHGVPLAPRGEGGPAAADELRLERFADHALGPERERPLERGVAAVRAIVLEASRVDPADAAQQPQSGVARVERLRSGGGARRAPHPVRYRRASHGVPYCRGPAVGGRVPPGEGTLEDPSRPVGGSRPRRPTPVVGNAGGGRRYRVGVRGEEIDRRRRHGVVLRSLARVLHQYRRRALAEPEARRRAEDSLGQSRLCLGAQLLGSREPAGEIVADVDDRLRLRLDREHRVERRDAPGLGGRDREALADVVQRSGRDPARARVRRP